MRTGLALGLIVIAAVALRCYGLETRSFWFDEAFSASLIRDFSWVEMIERTGRDVHPPLYYASLRVWANCFGDEVATLRLFSVAMAAASIVAIYLFARDAFAGADGTTLKSNSVGLTAAALLASCPSHILWSQETRMYTMAIALILWSNWLLLRAIRTNRWRWYLLVAAASLYVHNYALFSIAGQSLFAVGYGLYQYIKNRNATVLWKSCLATAAISWIYLPWLPVLIQQKQRVSKDYWIDGIGFWTVPDALQQLAFPVNFWRVAEHGTSLAVVLIIVAVVVALALRLNAGRALIIATIVVPIACAVLISLISVPIVHPRHFLFAYVSAFSGLACAIHFIPRKMISRTIVAALILNGLWYTAEFYAQEMRLDGRPGIRGAVEYLRENMQPGERLVASHPCIHFSLKKYLSDDEIQPILYVPTGQVSHYMGRPLLREGDVRSIGDIERLDATSLWVVETNGYTLGWKSLGLPASWVRDVSVEGDFQDVYYFQGLVQVRRYVRESNAAPNLD